MEICFCLPDSVNGQEDDDSKTKIAELIRDIDKNPNRLHRNYTPAVDALIKIGPPAIKPLLDVMQDEREVTRRRAQTALVDITMISQGWQPGRPWADPNGEAKWREFWKSLGNLQWDASKEDREKSIKQWQIWLSNQPNPK